MGRPRICSTCRWWAPVSEQAGGEPPERDEAALGTCHAEAPRAQPASVFFQRGNGHPPVVCTWPVCAAAEFCGHWSKLTP